MEDCSSSWDCGDSALGSSGNGGVTGSNWRHFITKLCIPCYLAIMLALLLLLGGSEPTWILPGRQPKMLEVNWRTLERDISMFWWGIEAKIAFIIS